MDMKTSRPEILKVYKRRRVRCWPALPEEMVYEILVRLPVKALMRFKSVSKAWRTTISDPCFTRSHLRQSTNNQQRKPSFLITPLTTVDKVIQEEEEAWPTNLSNHIPFYSWQHGQDDARLLHSKVIEEEAVPTDTSNHTPFGMVYAMLHCDGLVVISTDTKVYVFNPAMHDLLKLPDGLENVWDFPIVGFGINPRTNRYEVARFFYRYLDFSNKTYSIGMEIFTIGGGDDINSYYWRSVAEDPPLPIGSGTVWHFKGSLYSFVWDELVESPTQGGVLRFNFEDETFSFISYPKLLSSEREQLNFLELGGELCLAEGLVGKQVIWMLSRSGEWAQHLPEPEPWKFSTLSIISKDLLLIHGGNCLYYYDDARKDVSEVVRLDRLSYKNPSIGSFDFVGRDDIFMFVMISYTESLLPVIKPRQHLEMYPDTPPAKMSDEDQPYGRSLPTVVTEASSKLTQ